MTAPLSVAQRSDAAGVRRRRGRSLAGTALVVLTALLGTWLLWDNRRLDITWYEVEVPTLAESADGLRIAHISDLHAADFGTFHSRLREATADAHPDLIALTGDLIDRGTADLGPTLALVEELTRIAPTYYVLGNHEADSDLRDELLAGLEEREVAVLRDESASFEHASGRVTIAGLDDPRVRSADGLPAQDPRSALAALGLPAHEPVILLAHRPERFARYAGADVDVVLSGHAHGGQVRIPGIGGLVAPHQGLFPRLTAGVHQQDGTAMVISRGLGNSIAAVRVGNPRELVIVDLRAAGAPHASQGSTR